MMSRWAVLSASMTSQQLLSENSKIIKRSWASWKTSAYTPTHSHTRIKKSLCYFAMPHIANPPTRQNITHTRAKHSNPPPLLSVTVCVIAKTCKCLCHKLPKSQLNASQSSRWMSSQPYPLPTSAKFVSCYSTRPRRCCHPLLGNCGGDDRCHQQGFTSSTVEWQEAGESNRTH